MSDKSLLPANATPLERALAQTILTLLDTPVPLNQLWDADTCPVALLPYLASARSVDRWNANWPEDVKRRVVRDAFAVHQRKGTAGALRRAIEPLGYRLGIQEWWQTEPPGPRGTFALDIGINDTGLSDTGYDEIEHIVDDVRPLSRRVARLTVSTEIAGHVGAHAACLEGDSVTVYPYMPEFVGADVASCSGAAAHVVEIITVSNG
ncbi:phage tail protein I [Ralstonia mannitolilytica]|uniref:phage tail protein I n=1 Tax=Ralstonia mannitolilytica TaxID=105219 RepID=UPI000CEE3E60|nr:phage tail protein I [Ralstonia mannitolilytica]MBU9579048.1 phage tail protein I [Ralstonia mannitolilytica]